MRRRSVTEINNIIRLFEYLRGKATKARVAPFVLVRTCASMEEKFKTVQDVADWLEERGFPQEVIEAFIGNTLWYLRRFCA